MSEKKEIDKNLDFKGKNLEKLKKNFPQCFDKNGNFDLEKFKREISANNEINFSSESYSLDWLGKSYAKVLTTDNRTTFLKEDQKWNEKKENKKSENLLIKGDNLEVLKHLVGSYHEEVKMIYIDPPYNTGSDGFVYQDDRKFSPEMLSELAGIDEEKAERILEFTRSKSNSHSAWLTFMYPRLYIAKQLLKDDGVIFVSIDDNEVAQLRLLMDEIFGEENFVADIIWEKTYAPKNNSKHFSENHDYILVFAKNIENLICNGLERSKEANSRYRNLDNDKRGVWKSVDFSVMGENKKNIYPIVTPKGRKVYPPNGRSWLFPQIKFEELKKDNKIWFGSNDNSVPSLKRFLTDVKITITPQTIWTYEEVGHTQSATQYLIKLFSGEKYFDFPKSVSLIQKMLKLYSDEDSIILDFFAGSGTTGDAVMQLNAEDGGNRKYILVQLPEEIDKKKNKTAYDFVKNELKVENPTIFDITKERLVRAGKKILKENGEQKNPKDFSAVDFGFKIFETEKIPENFEFEAEEQSKENKLFEYSSLKEKDLESLALTWKTEDGVLLTKDFQEIDFEGYKGLYVDGKLYLMFSGFEIQHLENILKKIEEDKEFNPNVVYVFGPNFESARIKEFSDNITNFNNKKSLEIDFIVRNK